MSQCPASFKSTDATLAATSFICGPRIAALAFSPAMDIYGTNQLNFCCSLHMIDHKVFHGHLAFKMQRMMD